MKLATQIKSIILFCFLIILVSLTKCDNKKTSRPNILLAVADDWSWPHASINGTPQISTPAFDRVAEEGVLFIHSFCSAPSCTPSRGAILTGQYHWRLEEGGNLWSTLPAKFPVYTNILEKHGYFTGYTGKGWGPGQIGPGGREQNPAGNVYQKEQHKSPEGISNIDYFENFKKFMDQRQENSPFCFWYTGYEPHRVYKQGIGEQHEKDPSEVIVPKCLPDNSVVRNDILDYFTEVEWFDTQLDSMLQYLEKIGELKNTLVIVTSDNGMPFPRCKGNLYDMGTRMPLAIMWHNEVKGGRRVEDFVNLTDLAPTILEVAGVHVPEEMSGKSLMNILNSRKKGIVDSDRNHTLTGKERHAWVRQGGRGYPMRAIRTSNFLYIINFKPNRWPAGDPINAIKNDPPVIYGDIDDSPTKQFMLDHREDSNIQKLFQIGFEKRPATELYDLRKDPGQLNNVAYDPVYKSIRDSLSQILMDELKQTDDPRILGQGDLFDRYPYRNKRFHPDITLDSMEIYLDQDTMITEVTSTSVLLQTRLITTDELITGKFPGTGGIAQFVIDTNKTFKNPVRTDWQLAQPENDYTIQEKIKGLNPGTRYFFRVKYGKTGNTLKSGKIHQFLTLPN